MDPRTERFESLSRCLLYPAAGAVDAARRAATLWSRQPGLAQRLGELAEWLEERTLGEAEEAYTRVFDLNPVCSLHLGYHLFEETYARGALLAGLMSERNRVGLIAVTSDLPDFLPEVLRLVARLPEDDACVLASSLMLPALEKIVVALADQTVPWVPIILEIAGAIQFELDIEWTPEPMEAPHA